MEDGAALGVLFSNLRSKEEVHHRLELFQKLRFDRVSAIQILSSVGQDEIHKVIGSAQPYFQGPVPSKSFVLPIASQTSPLNSVGGETDEGFVLTISAATPDGLNEYNFTPSVMRDALELLQQDHSMSQ